MALMAAFIVTSISCSTQSTEVEPAGETNFDWSDPMPEGIDVVSIDEAGLAFTPIIPASLASPERMTASAPTIPEERRTLVLVYEGTEGEPFVIFEYLVDSSAAMDGYKELASAKPGCTDVPPVEGLGSTDSGQVCHEGARELVDVGDGRIVLSTTAEGGVAVLGIANLDSVDEAAVIKSGFAPDPAIQIDIEGPPGSIDTKAALSLIESMFAQAQSGAR